MLADTAVGNCNGNAKKKRGNDSVGRTNLRDGFGRRWKKMRHYTNGDEPVTWINVLRMPYQGIEHWRDMDIGDVYGLETRIARIVKIQDGLVEYVLDREETTHECRIGWFIDHARDLF